MRSFLGKGSFRDASEEACCRAAASVAGASRALESECVCARGGLKKSKRARPVGDALLARSRAAALPATTCALQSSRPQKANAARCAFTLCCCQPSD